MGNQGLRFVQFFQNLKNDVQITFSQFAPCCKSVRCGLFPHGFNTGAVIIHMDPVSDLHTVAVNWKKFVLQGTTDHQRDQFFWDW